MPDEILRDKPQTRTLGEQTDVRAIARHTGQVHQFADPVEFLSTVSFAELPERKIDTAALASITPDVLNKERIKFLNVAPVTVTDFLNGQEGQAITLYGDGQTTIANNSTVKTNTGANKLLATLKTYSFTRFSSVWVEQDAGGSVTAGAGISVTGTAVANIYVGKCVTLFASEVTTTVAAARPFPNNVRKAVVVTDTTGMGQFRISITGSSAAGTGGITPELSYSTDGSSWSNTAVASMNNFATGTDTKLSAWTTLAAGAKGATMYLALRYETFTQDVVVNTISIEFKP